MRVCVGVECRVELKFTFRLFINIQFSSFTEKCSLSTHIESKKAFKMLWCYHNLIMRLNLEFIICLKNCQKIDISAKSKWKFI